MRKLRGLVAEAARRRRKQPHKRIAPILPSAEDHEPPSVEDRAKLREKQRKYIESWVDDRLEQIFTFADYDPQLAMRVGKTVADHFGPRDDVARMMLGRLRVDREGKKRGARKVESEWLLAFTLFQYNMHLLEGTEKREAKEKLQRLERVGKRSVENRLSRARKLARGSNLTEADWVVSILHLSSEMLTILRKRG